VPQGCASDFIAKSFAALVGFVASTCLYRPPALLRWVDVAIAEPHRVSAFMPRLALTSFFPFVVFSGRSVLRFSDQSTLYRRHGWKLHLFRLPYCLETSSCFDWNPTCCDVAQATSHIHLGCSSVLCDDRTRTPSCCCAHLTSTLTTPNLREIIAWHKAGGKASNFNSDSTLLFPSIPAELQQRGTLIFPGRFPVHALAHAPAA